MHRTIWIESRHNLTTRLRGIPQGLNGRKWVASGYLEIFAILRRKTNSILPNRCDKSKVAPSQSLADSSLWCGFVGRACQQQLQLVLLSLVRRPDATSALSSSSSFSIQCATVQDGRLKVIWRSDFCELSLEGVPHTHNCSLLHVTLRWLVKELCRYAVLWSSVSVMLCQFHPISASDFRKLSRLVCPFLLKRGSRHKSPKVALWPVMEIPKKNALIISSHVTGLEPLEGAYKNAEDASKVLRRMKIPAECQFGGRLSLTQFMEKIEEFFEIESDLHILWGIFHGERGCWVLSNKELVSLFSILQKWYFARGKGTAHHLLIVSDACESGLMVTEAAERALEDVSVQASCHPSFTSLDTEGECFSDLLVWRLERRYGFQCHRERKIDMKVHLERSILNCHQPRFYSAVSADDLGWAFIDTSAVFSDLSDSSESCSLDGSVAESDEGSSLFVRKDFYLLGEVVIVCVLLTFQLSHPQSPPSERNGMFNFIRLPNVAALDDFGKWPRFNLLRRRPGIGSYTEAQKRLRGLPNVAALEDFGRWPLLRRRPGIGSYTEAQKRLRGLPNVAALDDFGKWPRFNLLRRRPGIGSYTEAQKRLRGLPNVAALEDFGKWPASISCADVQVSAPTLRLKKDCEDAASGLGYSPLPGQACGEAGWN